MQKINAMFWSNERPTSEGYLLRRKGGEGDSRGSVVRRPAESTRTVITQFKIMSTWVPFGCTSVVFINYSNPFGYTASFSFYGKNFIESEILYSVHNVEGKVPLNVQYS